jgi:iron complex outermembrane receptor protein
LLVASVAAAGTAMAAEKASVGRETAPAEDGDGLGEIIVTAQKRSENIQRTPIAVTAFGEEAIKQQGISTFRDITSRVPGLFSPKASSSATTQQYAIRGIGEPDSYPEPAVAVYVDDVFLARTVGSVYDTPDLERVEVLRGPQGTLYGRNSSAGAIRFITKEPTAQTRVDLKAAYGSYDNVDLQARVAGAILPNDALNGSFSVIRHQRDGWLFSIPLQKHVNDLDFWVIRSKLKSQLADGLTVTLSGDAMWDRSSQTYRSPINQPNGVVGGAGKTDPKLTWEDTEPYNFTTAYGGSVTLNYAIDPHLTLKSVSAYRAMHGPIYYANDGVTSIKSDSYNAFWEHQITQEFSLNGEFEHFNFVAGLYYFNEYFHNDRLSQAVASTTDNIGTVTSSNNWLRTKSYSAYGQLNYNVTDRLTATIGGRYTTDRRKFHNIGGRRSNTQLHDPSEWGYSIDRFNELYGPYTAVFDATAEPKSFSRFTPKIGLQYQFDRDIFGYASFSEGFKSGGYDLRATTEVATITPYRPQITQTYEVGLKTKFLNNRVVANLALYYNKIKDIQFRANCFPPYCAVPFSGLINAGDGNTRGGEIEISALPFEGLRLNGTAAYLKTEYDTFTATLPANVPGRTTLLGLDFPYAPKWQLTFGADYRLPLKVEGEWRIAADVQHRTKAYAEIYNTAQQLLPPETFVNGSLTYTFPDNKLSVGLQARNIFDVQQVQASLYVPTGAGANPFYAGTYNEPRTVNAFIRTSF